MRRSLRRTSRTLLPFFMLFNLHVHTLQGQTTQRDAAATCEEPCFGGRNLSWWMSTSLRRKGRKPALQAINVRWLVTGRDVRRWNHYPSFHVRVPFLEIYQPQMGQEYDSNRTLIRFFSGRWQPEDGMVVVQIFGPLHALTAAPLQSQFELVVSSAERGEDMNQLFDQPWLWRGEFVVRFILVRRDVRRRREDVRAGGKLRG
eukprot:763004-Hanusia_phi.AAC.2